MNSKGYKIIANRPKTPPPEQGRLITFEILDNGKRVTIDTNDYKNYGSPVKNIRMVEPDGDIFVSKLPSFCIPMGRCFVNNMSDGMLSLYYNCRLHDKALGCKFDRAYKDGRPTIDFKTRDLTDCLCYGRFATQYDYDKYCYKKLKEGDINFLDSDNGKIFKLLSIKK